MFSPTTSVHRISCGMSARWSGTSDGFFLESSRLPEHVRPRSSRDLRPSRRSIFGESAAPVLPLDVDPYAAPLMPEPAEPYVCAELARPSPSLRRRVLLDSAAEEELSSDSVAARPPPKAAANHDVD